MRRALVEAYLDESGIHEEAKVCVIGGYFAGPSRWKKFESDWKKLLHKFKIPIEKFHAQAMLPRLQHRPFLQAAAETIASHDRIRPISAGIVVEDFFSFSEPDRRWMTGGRYERGRLIASGCPDKPYFVPFQRCIVDVANYVPDGGGKLDVFCGLGTAFAGYATELFRQIKASKIRHPWKEKLGDLRLPEARITPQIQAADLLVHLTYQHMLDGIDQQIENRLPSTLLDLCIRNRRSMTDFYFMNHRNLEEGRQTAMLLSQPSSEW